MPPPFSKHYRSRLTIIILSVSLILIVFWGSLRIHDYTQHDPDFCINCHLMQPAYKTWKVSIHKNLECHDCHYATILERNQMLLKALFESPTKVSPRPHEKILVPATTCIQCHWKPGKPVPQISESTGHALHWFKAGVECTRCHAIQLHKFEPEQRFCVECHPAGKKNLGGMTEMLCSECHNFRSGKLIPDSTACRGCHEQEEPVKANQTSQPHRPFGCIACHRVHHPERSAGKVCRDCHQLAIQRGKHPLRLAKLKNRCTPCHKPHRWKITEKESGGICAQC